MPTIVMRDGSTAGWFTIGRERGPQRSTLHFCLGAKRTICGLPIIRREAGSGRLCGNCLRRRGLKGHVARDLAPPEGS